MYGYISIENKFIFKVKIVKLGPFIQSYSDIILIIGNSIAKVCLNITWMIAHFSVQISKFSN